MTDTLLDAYRREPTIARRNAIVEAHWPLVRKIAFALSAKLFGAIGADDLAGDGVFGLLDAIRLYDPARGVKFASFARRRIHGAMLDAIRAWDWVPRRERVRQKRGECVPAAMVSLHGDYGEDDFGEDVQLANLIADPRAEAPEDAPADRDEVRWILRSLTARQQVIARGYYMGDLTQRDIAEAIDRCESLVSWTNKRMLRKLRRMFGAEVMR
jgi:RNA polymerase sigma factor for flagellar operon FliA